MASRMKAAVPGRIVLDEKPIPEVGPLDALVRVTTTTICGTDVHILKGECPARGGLTVGEPVGVIEKLESAVQGYRESRRVIAGAPSGYSNAWLAGCHAQDGAGTAHGWKPLGGWKFGNTIDGCQAEYLLVLDAMANLAPVPDGLTDEQVLMCPDIMSTGFAGAESGQVRIGDAVAVFAQGPIGLCATVGARLMGATTHHRRGERAGPDRDDKAPRGRPRGRFSQGGPGRRVLRLTNGRGVDVAIEASGTQATFEACLHVLRPGRHVVQPGRLLQRPPHPTRRLCGRDRRPQDRHRPLPRRQGAHAAADGGGGLRPRRSPSLCHTPFHARPDRGRL
jgi:alcohol dehydrogenase